MAISEQENVQTVQQLYAAFVRGDIAAVLNALTDDVEWHVQIMERYAHGQGVAAYLARYLRGGPFSPARVVAWDAQTVTFRYADNQDPDGQGRGTRKLLTF